MTEALHWSSLRILCVDENKGYGRLIDRMLRDLGVRDITLADDVEKARGMFADAPFDFVFVNRLPDSDSGIEFTEFLRKKDETPAPNVPVIWTVDEGTIEQITTAIRYGADHVLIKPISVGEIESTLNGLNNNPPQKTDVENYVGPCRRRLPARVYGTFSGQDRRQQQAAVAAAG